jgi:hypothetical protein
LDTEPAHHDHHTLGEIIADSLRRSGIATAEEADAFIAAWWEALNQDRKEAEAETRRKGGYSGSH